jgi:hypothetical protein
MHPPSLEITLPPSGGSASFAGLTGVPGDNAALAAALGAKLNLTGGTLTGGLSFSGTTHAGLTLNNLTTTERNAIASPQAGMVLWNTTTSRVNVHNGSAWTDGFVRLAGDTMTGALGVTLTSLGTTPTAGFTLANSTAAAAGAQQVSPSLVIEGQGWKTDATAASQIVRFRQNVLPVQGAANPTATLQFQSEINNSGTWDNQLNITSAGNMYRTFTSTFINLGGSDIVLENQSSGRLIEARFSGNGLFNVVGTNTLGPRLGFSTTNGNTNPDLQLTRAAAASLQLGANTATASATATAQTIKGPNATGTTSTGGSLTLAGGTGTTAGGSVILAASATTGAPATAVTVNNNAVTTFAKPPVLPAYTVATLPATAANGMVQGAHAIVTDAVLPTYLGALTGGGAVVCPVFYNGASWVSH